MAAKLAGYGYAVLLPDVYYRSGDWAPFDMATVFGDESERNRLFVDDRQPDPGQDGQRRHARSSTTWPPAPR